jgi:hypothetical protein
MLDGQHEKSILEILIKMTPHLKRPVKQKEFFK